MEEPRVEESVTEERRVKESGAFGWPVGTVRAVLALMVVGTALMVAVYIIARFGGAPSPSPLVLLAASAIWGGMNLALGYYLGKGDTPLA